jgi:divalent metal cation (Fe/Co/Zn/Cd) transporter
LLDKAPIEESKIVDLAKSVDGVCTCHRVRTRGMSGEIYVDLHIGVDSSLTIEAAHKVAKDVEHRIKSKIVGVKDVVVHLEPKGYCEIRAQNGSASLE